MNRVIRVVRVIRVMRVQYAGYAGAEGSHARGHMHGLSLDTFARYVLDAVASEHRQVALRAQGPHGHRGDAGAMQWRVSTGRSGHGPLCMPRVLNMDTLLWPPSEHRQVALRL